MNKMEHILDTITHKKYILEVGESVIKKMIEDGKEELAFELGKRFILHDNSKVSDEEVSNFVKIENYGNMKNPEVLMDERLKENIALHWKNNRHHPEHFEDYHQMNEIDIWEMCCDWYSRSLQNKTNFLSFVEKRQEIRFKFDQEFFNKVLYCCEYIDKAYRLMARSE